MIPQNPPSQPPGYSKIASEGCSLDFQPLDGWNRRKALQGQLREFSSEEALRIENGLVKGLCSRRFRSMDSLAARLPQNKESSMKIRHLGTFRLGGEGKVWSENWLGYRDMFDYIHWTRQDCARHLRRFYGEPEYSAKIHRFRGSSVTEARMVLGIVTAWAECERVGQGTASPRSASPAKVTGTNGQRQANPSIP